MVAYFLIYFNFDQFLEIEIQINSINDVSFWILSNKCDLNISLTLIWRKLFIYFQYILVCSFQSFVLLAPFLEVFLRKILFWIFLSEDNISSWLSITLSGNIASRILIIKIMSTIFVTFLWLIVATSALISLLTFSLSSSWTSLLILIFLSSRSSSLELLIVSFLTTLSSITLPLLVSSR